MKRNSWLLLLGLTALLSVAMAPYLVGAGLTPLEQSRRQAIGEMSRIERDRLEQNYRRWRALNTERKEHLRALGLAMRQDREENRGDLTRVLDVYMEWVKTLPQEQREALRNETNPLARLALAHKYAEQQQATLIEEAEGFWGETIPVVLLNDQDFRKVVDAAADHLRKTGELSAEDEERLESFTVDGLRFLYLMSDVRSTRGDDRRSFRSPEVERFFDVIGGQLKDIVERAAGAGDPEQLDRGLVISASMRASLRTRMPRMVDLSDESLKALYESLPAARQSELREMSAGRFRRELVQIAVERKLEELKSQGIDPEDAQRWLGLRSPGDWQSRDGDRRGPPGGRGFDRDDDGDRRGPPPRGDGGDGRGPSRPPAEETSDQPETDANGADDET